jgi:LacI family transcriptional regulator
LLRISRSTVSRAFSRADLLSEQTVKNVHAAARKLGYQPNRVARALSTGRHGNIAIVVPDVANPFFPPLLRSSQSAADSSGYSLFLGDSDEDPAREFVLLDKLVLQTDGFVIASSRMTDEKIQELAERHPLVLINRDTKGIPRVLIDTSAGIGEGVAHLVELGHQRMVYVGGPAASWSDQQRRLAVKRYCGRRDIALEQITAQRPTFEAGRAVAAAILKTKATAAIAFDDFVAQGLMAGLSDLGVVVPRDFSIIGCDDVLGAATSPALTSVSGRAAEAGRIAVDMLLGMLEGGPVSNQRRLLDTHLVVRGTTGPCPSENYNNNKSR